MESGTRLFGTHRDALLKECRRSRAMRVLRHRTTAEDIVDEVFVRALSSGLLDRFEPRGRGSLRSALGIVLRRTLQDACRRHGAARRAAFREVGDTIVAGDGEPLDRGPSPTAEVRVREILSLCRKELPPREWDAWSLSEVQGLSSVEVGQRLGMSASAVRGLVLRARQRLLARLRRGPSEPPADHSSSP